MNKDHTEVAMLVNAIKFDQDQNALISSIFLIVDTSAVRELILENRHI